MEEGKDVGGLDFPSTNGSSRNPIFNGLPLGNHWVTIAKPQRNRWDCTFRRLLRGTAGTILG